MRQIKVLVVYFWENIYMHQICDVWNNFIVAVKLLSTIVSFFCHQNKTFKRLSKMVFI